MKFIKLSKYASSLFSNYRDEICYFLIGVSKKLEEECRAAMLHKNMDLSRLMVHAQQIEDSRVRKTSKEAMKIRYLESSSSKSRLDVKANTKFKRGFKIRLLQISSRI